MYCVIPITYRAPHLFPPPFDYGQLNAARPLLGGSRIDPTALVIRTAEDRMDRRETNREWMSPEEAHQAEAHRRKRVN
ncbi:MAG: hypothetical protein F4Y84_03805 [Caldilineaceae bacterium SB0665_bin_25]|nr:hypothetical protein [Caldilineaceae bacterium SB0665_bin_25]